MAIKVVALFQVVTGGQAVNVPLLNYSQKQHIGGWSESIWWFDNNVGNLTAALTSGYNGQDGLLPARARLLAKNALCIGVRLYQGGAGKGVSLAFNYPGNNSWEQDVPQMALLCKAGNSGAAVARRFTLRGLPDNMVSNGEWDPTPAFATNLANYFGALGNFVFQAQNPTNPKLQIFNITPAGLVTLNGVPNPWNVGQIITIQKTLNANGQFVSGNFTITAIGPMSNNFTVAAWTGGLCTGGIATVKATGLWGITPSLCIVERVLVRKVGRPFEQYRGRRSKRKKTA